MKDVMATFAGHDHDNDYIGMLYNVGLAFGRVPDGTLMEISSGVAVSLNCVRASLSLIHGFVPRPERNIRIIIRLA